MHTFYISAAHKSSGKTTLSIGLSAAIKKLGHSVRAFKKGPDFIDPMWLAEATGQDCHNLDFFTSSKSFIQNQFQQYSNNNDVILVEGNMGLYDGISIDGSDSNAAMAKLLGLPIVLVVDCSGTSRGIAPLLNGYQSFDQDLNFAGVILNKVAGERHAGKLKEVIETHTDFDILGIVHRNPDIGLTERHLGLIPNNEMHSQSGQIIELLSSVIEDSVDIDRLLNKTFHDPVNKHTSTNKISLTQNAPTLRVAYASDPSFGFYYPGDKQLFAELGVQLVPFDTLESNALPEHIDGLFIGGGFPETHAKELSQNTALKTDIRESIKKGLPTYAECGGLMYLCSSIELENMSYPFCDVISSTVTMHQKPQGRGYVKLKTTDDHPWYGQNTQTIQAHEFHYSSITPAETKNPFAYCVERGKGINGTNDGIIINNLLASYAHLRGTDTCSWVNDFINFVKHCNYLKQ